MVINLKIEIWFDFTCPFSYVGLKRFSEALENFKNKKDVRLFFRSYNLNPHITKTLNINAYEYLAQHKDITTFDAKKIYEGLTKKYAEEEIFFDFDNLIPSTSIKAHNLLKFIEDDCAKIAFINHVFVSHFEKGKDISDLNVLLDIAKNVALKEDDVKAVYQTDMYEGAINNDFIKAESFGLNGVPAFVVDESYYLMGSHSKEAYLEMLDTFYRKAVNKQPSVAEYCIDESC